MSGIMIIPRPSREEVRGSYGTAMGLLFVTFSALTSRLFLLGLWIFSKLLGEAFGPVALPILGAIFLPWTTCAYAAMWGIASDGVNGWEWIVVGLAFLFDLATWTVTVRLIRR
jgi:hypothetical protein